MFYWLFELFRPNYDPPPPRENVLRMAHDVVKYRRRALMLATAIGSTLSVLNSELAEDERIRVAKEFLALVLSDAEKIE